MVIPSSLSPTVPAGYIEPNSTGLGSLPEMIPPVVLLPEANVYESDDGFLTHQGASYILSLSHLI
jgi:hypothetical protein